MQVIESLLKRVWQYTQKISDIPSYDIITKKKRENYDWLLKLLGNQYRDVFDVISKVSMCSFKVINKKNCINILTGFLQIWQFKFRHYFV